MWAIDSQIKKYFCPFVWRLKGKEEGLLSGRLGGRTLLPSLSRHEMVDKLHSSLGGCPPLRWLWYATGELFYLVRWLEQNFNIITEVATRLQQSFHIFCANL